MVVLSIADVEIIIKDFIAKYSNELECKIYKDEEIVRREGEISKKIYIVNDGVFRIGKIDHQKTDMTIAFAWKNNVIAPVSSIVDNFPAIFELKSIENKLSNTNSIYEINIEQWNYFAKKDPKLKELPKSFVYENIDILLNLYSLFRKNRNTEKVLKDLYNAKHPVLNSGIPSHYIADLFGIKNDTFNRILNDIKYR